MSTKELGTLTKNSGTGGKVWVMDYYVVGEKQRILVIIGDCSTEKRGRKCLVAGRLTMYRCWG